MISISDIEKVDCPVCGPTQTKIWLDDGKPTKYVQCRSCKTVYASPRALHEKRYAWLNHTFSLSDDIFTLTDSRLPSLNFEAQLIQRITNSGRILDVGCSIGVFLSLFSASDWDRYGIELVPTAAEYASQTYNIQVHTGLLASSNYPDNFFDFATMIDTLYYLDNPLADFQEINRILKPGGKFAVEIAGQAYILRRNYGLIPYILDRRWSRASSDSSYLSWFSPKGLARLLKKCDFEPLYWYVIPSPQSSNELLRFLGGIHYSIASFLLKISDRSLLWAPKYLCISQKLKY